jgi:hypothetical protein
MGSTPSRWSALPWRPLPPTQSTTVEDVAVAVAAALAAAVVVPVVVVAVVATTE